MMSGYREKISQQPYSPYRSIATFFYLSYSNLTIVFIFKMLNRHCSERNNTDLVGVTWPGAGGRKSRVGRTIPAHHRPDR
ncbi:hypothetical protein T05_4292 [Trichinella murrelli]|uniref:Uncharacterized protein n=1 Tax=Trichinella murrelli TaxID=144512 RepID=A0A0V0TJA6_9BILA|nr:hypothetical protein T05_4292 [Trichinella murrelli]